MLRKSLHSLDFYTPCVFLVHTILERDSLHQLKENRFIRTNIHYGKNVLRFITKEATIKEGILSKVEDKVPYLSVPTEGIHVALSLRKTVHFIGNLLKVFCS